MGAATLLALLAALGVTGSSLAAPPGVQLISHRVEVVPDEPSIHLCPHLELGTQAQIWDVTTFRRQGTTQQTLRPATRGNVIRASIASSTIASVAPPIVVLDPADRTARFTIKGLKPGRTRITLTEASGSAVSPGTIDVIVDDCKFKFSGWSTWNFPDGFEPQTYAIFQNLAMVWHEDLQRFLGSVKMENTAVAGNPNGCTVIFDVAPSNVLVEGTPNGAYIDVEITYSNVQVATKAKCGVSGGRADSAKPDKLTMTLSNDMRRAQYGRPYPGHILRASMAVPGQTFIKVQVTR